MMKSKRITNAYSDVLRKMVYLANVTKSESVAVDSTLNCVLTVLR